MKISITNIKDRPLVCQQGGIVLMSQDEMHMVGNHQLRCDLLCVESLDDVTEVLEGDKEKGFNNLSSESS